MRGPEVTVQGAVRVRRSCNAPIAQVSEHRQDFFLQIQAVIGNLQLSSQATRFFFKLLTIRRCSGVLAAAGPGALLLNPATPFSANSRRQSES